MSVRNALLAILSEGPKYGSQLRTEFEDRTAKAWPLNIGQVYTTLARLERDGLVTTGDVADDLAPDLRHYELTAAGVEAVDDWFNNPVPHESTPRDELAIKLNVAMSLPTVDLTKLIASQRVESMRTLQSYTRLKGAADVDDIAWQVTLDLMIFHTEAELRWLDHCEQSVAIGRRRHGAQDRSKRGARNEGAKVR